MKVVAALLQPCDLEFFGVNYSGWLGPGISEADGMLKMLNFLLLKMYSVSECSR